MKCKAAHSKLIFFLERELPEPEMKAVQEHLAVCPDCALFAEEMKRTLSILETEKVSEVNPYFYTRVKAKLDRPSEIQLSGIRSSVLVRVLQPVAFSIVLILGVYGGVKMGATGAKTGSAFTAEQEMVPYLNEMDVEPLETFLME
ncbi:zf-HC2 domain-containing protein [Maribellus sp. YY47]|uniref:anti-sigma factor family protein n=1 Tax=Maribellus sp. YY47 TaxID=2929486 RepID=UPI0020016E9D|nr:zf-HC2 domain-containing protein [Maribellus sp. YY47]MCK3683647.1 zf-HC2 domain-containing protein [Maribellus sp. YY47]